MRFSPTSGFTLVEVLVSVMLSGLILTAGYSSFQGIMKSQIQLGGVIDIQRNLFYLNEKLASLIHKGGTLDYEEYFNRRILGYAQSFQGDPWEIQVFTFSTSSKYGNGSGATRPAILVCGRDASANSDACLGANAVGNMSLFAGQIPIFDKTLSGQQAYRQYRELGFNYGSPLPVPTRLPSIFPWTAPANFPNIGKNWISELYLIKRMPDGSYERVYFRHVFVQEPEKNPATHPCNPSTNTDNCLGKIQMTRLVSCDTQKTDGSSGSDGNIDFWIPHADFTDTPLNCAGVSTISGATDSLVWTDISTPDMSITQASFYPSPDKIPSLMAGTGETVNVTTGTGARSATVRVRLEVRLSERILRRGLLSKEWNHPRILNTTFDLWDV